MTHLQNETTQLFLSLNWMKESLNNFECIQHDKIALCDSVLPHEKLINMMRNSLVKSFCVTTSVFRNRLKQHLKKNMAQTHKVRSPRDVIQAAHEAKFISEKDLPIFLEMANDHSRASHAHETDTIEKIHIQISHRAAEYHALMLYYAQKLSPVLE